VKIKQLKNSEKFLWTNHSQQKMRFYRLSESRIKRIIRHPARVEKGIAPETIACMQRNDSKNLRRAQGKKEEIWVMYQTKTQKGEGKILIISAWRYPGVSPLGEPIPIPEDVFNDLKLMNADFEKC
jgi:hypothetical protein